MDEEHDTYLNLLLKHHEQMPSWYKDRLREIAGLDEKFEKSEEPLWKTKAFISNYRDMVFNTMVAHAHTCRDCYDKMNSIYLHCSQIERAKLDPKELAQIERSLISEMKRHFSNLLLDG